MRIRLAVIIAALAAAPALAQQTADPVANRIAAATEALSRFRPLDNGVWTSASNSHINDRRTGLARKIDVSAVQIGYDRRFISPFAQGDQLVLGVAGGLLNASSRAEAQNLQIDSKGWSFTGYGVYAPNLVLSFPVSLTVRRWSSDQTRDGTNLQPVYSTSYKSTSYASSVGAALTLPVSRFLATTSLSHRYNSNTRPAYLEAINPLATDFQFTPAETTAASQLFGNVRLALPFEAGRIWVSAGYAYDLKRRPTEDTRGEVPLGAGFDIVTPRWLFGIAGQTVLRHEITVYSAQLTGRLQF